MFCYLPIKSWCHKLFELFLANTITALKPVSCDHVTSFNYDDKKARDVDLTCWCHQSNIMLDSIFHENMRQGITQITLSFSFCLLLFNNGCCVFIQYNLLKGFCECILMQPWTQVIDYSLPGLTWHTRLRIGISHLSISGIVVHVWLFVGWSWFFFVLFSCLLTVVWATKNP